MGRGSVTNLKPNTQYSFRVRGKDQSGLFGGFSLPLLHWTTPGAAPDQVVGVQVKPILNGFNILWASQGLNVSHYEIWIAVGSGQGAESLYLYATTDSNIATIGPFEVDPDTGVHFTYTVGVRAVSKEGVQGPLSDPLATVQPLLRGGDGIPPPDPAAAPNVLSRMGINIVDMRAYNDQTLDWENMFLQFSMLIGGSWTSWEDLGQCGAIFLHTNLVEGIQYRYQYKVTDAEGLSSNYSPSSEGTNPNLIGSVDIVGGTILADLVESLVVDAGLITTSNDSTQPRIDISRDAFILWAKNTTNNQLYKAMYFPTNNNPGTINMHIIAQTLQALGGMTLSGIDNKLDKNANLVLEAAVADPTTPPAVQRYLPTMNIDNGIDTDRRGLAYSGGYFYTTSGKRVYEFSSSTGVINRTKVYAAGEAWPVGICVVGSSLVVLRESDGGRFFVTKYNISDLSETSHAQITSLMPNAVKTGGIDYDGSAYLYISYETNVAARMIKLNASNFNQVGGTVTLPAYNASNGDKLFDLAYEGGKISYQIRDASLSKDMVRRCQTDGSRTSAETAQEFESKGQGLIYATVSGDVARYWGIAKSENLLFKFTNWITVGPNYYARYAWQGSLSTYESKPSPATSFTAPNRWGVRVDVPSLPNSDVTSVDIYMARGSNDPYATDSSQYELQANSSDESVDIPEYVTTSSDAIKGPASSTGFVSGNGAKIIGSGTEFWGDGTLIPNSRASAPSTPQTEGEIYYNTGKQALGISGNGKWAYASGLANDPSTDDGTFTSGGQDITQYTVPANSVVSGTTFRLMASGQYDAVNANNVTFYIKYGSTNLNTLTVSTVATGNNKDWIVEAWVTFRGSGSSVTVTSTCWVRHALPTNPATEFETTKTSSISTTTSKDLTVNISATAANNIQIYTAFIEMMRG